MPGYNLINPADAVKLPYGLDAWVLYTSGDFEMIHLTLQPGKSVDPHSQPFDVIFYVLEGSGRITIGECTETISKGGGICVKGGHQRGWTNEGAIPLKVLVNKLLKVHHSDE